MYGSDKTLLLLLKNLDKSSFNPTVILPENGPLKLALENEKIKVIIAPVLKLYRNMFRWNNLLRFIKDRKIAINILDDLHKKHHFDVVYSNTLAVLLGLIYSNKRKIKHLWHVHEIIKHPNIVAAIFPKLLYKYADLVICNSNATKNNLTSRNSKLDKKTFAIYNGLEQQPYQTFEYKRESFGFQKDDIIITLVGRISRLKGHLWLLKTFLNNFFETKNIKLLFVGSPVVGQEFYLEEIKQFVHLNKLSQKVTILDFTNNIQEIWSMTDIAVMPSTEAESFGLVAAEAMLALKPVVASNLGGLSEIIINNETGFLVEPNNENQFAEALVKLIESPELRKTFGYKGNLRIKNEFSIEKHVTNFEEKIKKLNSK